MIKISTVVSLKSVAVISKGNEDIPELSVRGSIW